MAWGIEYRVLFCRSVDTGSSHFNGLTLGLFLIGTIHDVRQPPRVTTLVFGLLLKLLNGSCIDDAHRVDQVTTDGGLSGINVTDEDERSWGACLIDIDNIIVWHYIYVFDGSRDFFVLSLFLICFFGSIFLDYLFGSLLLLCFLLSLLLSVSFLSASAGLCTE